MLPRGQLRARIWLEQNGEVERLSLEERQALWAEIDRIVATPAGAKADRILDAVSEVAELPRLMSVEVEQAVAKLQTLYDRA